MWKDQQWTAIFSQSDQEQTSLSYTEQNGSGNIEAGLCVTKKVFIIMSANIVIFSWAKSLDRSMRITYCSYSTHSIIRITCVSFLSYCHSTYTSSSSRTAIVASLLIWCACLLFNCSTLWHSWKVHGSSIVISNLRMCYWKGKMIKCNMNHV